LSSKLLGSGGAETYHERRKDPVSREKRIVAVYPYMQRGGRESLSWLTSEAHRRGKSPYYRGEIVDVLTRKKQGRGVFRVGEKITLKGERKKPSFDGGEREGGETRGVGDRRRDRVEVGQLFSRKVQGAPQFYIWAKGKGGNLPAETSPFVGKHPFP